MKSKTIQLALVELAKMAAEHDSTKMQVELPEIGGEFLRVTLEFDIVETEEN